MIHLPRRYFHQAMNEKRWSKEKRMGGYIRGEESQRHTVQDSIDSLNAAIDRLDKIINEMREQANGNNK